MADSVVIRRLVAELGITVDDKKLEQFEAGLDSIKEQMVGLVDVAAKVATAVAAVGAVVGIATVHVAEMAFQTQGMAENMGMTNSEFQSSVAVLKRFGLEIDDIADLYGTLADRAQDAIDGTQSFIDDFKLLGITVDQLKGKKPQEVFELIIDSFDNSKDITKQLAAVARTFGDDLGRKVLPVLARTSEEFRRMRKEAEALGIVISDDGIKRLNNMRTSLYRLRGTFEGLVNTLAVQVAPHLEELADLISNYVLENIDEINTTVRAFGERLGNAARGIVDFGVRIAQVVGSPGFKQFIGYLEAGAVALGSIVAVSKAITFFSTLSTLASAAGVSMSAFAGATLTGIAAAVAPVLLLGGAIAALLLVVEDLYAYWTGGHSVLGTILTDYKHAEGLIGAISRALNAVIDSFGLMAGVLKNTVIPIWGLFKAGIMEAWDSLGVFQHFILGFYSVMESFWDNVIKPVLELLNPLKALEIGLNNLAKGLNFFLNNQTNRDMVASGNSPFLPQIAAVPPMPSPSVAMAGGQTTNQQNTVNFGGVNVNASGMDPQTAQTVTEGAMGNAVKQAFQNFRTGAR